MADIISADNKKIKQAVKLRDSAKARKEEGLFFLEGLRLCLDAVNCGITVTTAFYTLEAFKKHKEIAQIINNAECSFSVSQEVCAKLGDTVNTQGIICICKMPKNTLNKGGLIIGLENTQDPSNLGAIARSAEAFGANGIVVSGLGCDPFSPKSLRASMGALLRLPVISQPDFLGYLKKAKQSGANIIASVVKGDAQILNSGIKTNNDILLIGNEANGLSQETKSIANTFVTIKMNGKAESLNASCAAAVLIYELTK